MVKPQLLPAFRPSVAENAGRFRRRFLAGKPFRHVVIRNAFGPAAVDALREELGTRRLRRTNNRLYAAGQLSLARAKTPVARSWFRFILQDFLPWVESVADRSLCRLLVQPMAYRYGRSDYLKPHNDATGQRAIAFILNLSDFSVREGGRLLLLECRRNNRLRVVKKLPHRFNSVVLFEVSDKSVHQIEPLATHKKRLTVSGWMLERKYERVLARQLRRGLLRDRPRAKRSRRP